PSDRPETLDYGFMARVTRAVLGAALDLARPGE
ncbi:MAG: aminopeptidase, partial [Gemmatimonadetes bacterium]|nr:aminopeptidase [Gemmatimonadota bacterium]NIQ56486.1 aminopeptidase [Gemmatimonadota bacterium]NIU76674.1 aminopeptidase [Gammaproteobacteria bacterium]NIX22438.1 aminopeptidase [Actinomycetota bacterium]NIX46109.1 aminopeptidase [Gemmatimonadota bacterium]